MASREGKIQKKDNALQPLFNINRQVTFGNLQAIQYLVKDA